MRNHRKLETMEYADNLSSYLDSARSCRTITLADFDNVLHALCGKESAKTDTSLVDSAAEEDYKIGENVAVFWMDETVQWFLGVVDSNVGANGNILISYLTRSDSTGCEWIFPEDAEIIETSPEQILARNIEVEYRCSIRVRCRILSHEVIAELNRKIGEMSKS